MLVYVGAEVADERFGVNGRRFGRNGPAEGGGMVTRSGGGVSQAGGMEEGGVPVGGEELRGRVHLRGDGVVPVVEVFNAELGEVRNQVRVFDSLMVSLDLGEEIDEESLVAKLRYVFHGVGGYFLKRFSVFLVEAS